LNNIIKRETFQTLKDLFPSQNSNDVAFFITGNAYNSLTDRTESAKSNRKCRFSSPTKLAPKRSRSSLRKTNDSLAASTSSMRRSPSKEKAEVNNIILTVFML